MSQASYLYDVLDRRIAKTVNGAITDYDFFDQPVIRKSMPSIEILVSKEPNFKLPPAELIKYKFAVQTSSPPKSHRVPSLWQEELQSLGGVLFHLGNEEFKGNPDGWFYASEIIEDKNFKRFTITDLYRDDFFQFIKMLLANSDNKELLFTTDWQFGPKEKQVFRHSLNLKEFVALHDAEGIELNSSYSIKS